MSFEEKSKLYSILEKLGTMRNAVESVDRDAWAQMTFTQRVAAYDWTLELWVLGTFVVFIVAFLVGRNANKQMVDAVYAAVEPKLRHQFAVVGCSANKPIVKDSDTRYTTYATGRVNIESLLVRFRMKERQSIMTRLVGLLVPTLASADGLGDHIEVVITPTDATAVKHGIFGILHKEVLAETQEKFYFEKYAKIADSDALPSPVYTSMYEHPDLAVLLTPTLKEALASAAGQRVFRSVVYSDLPSQAPTRVEDVSSSPRVHLSLNFPATASERDAAAAIVNASIELVDLLVDIVPFRASTIKKIAATREAEVARIRRIEEDEKKEELAAQRAEQRREQARRESTLSEKEQRKLKKKEQEKQARKQRQKMSRRG